MSDGKKEEHGYVSGFCPTCNAHKIFKVIGKYYPPGVWNEADYEFENVFAVCEICSMPALLTRYFEMGDENPNGNYKTVYPPTKEDARKLGFDIPEQIASSYNEAVKCEEKKAWNACAVMVGRALEAVSKDFDPKVRRITTGLRKMYDSGAISQELFEWANELRVIRNIGAHADGVEVAEMDATESLDFLQAILETIYHLRPVFKKMKERRANKK